LNHRKRIDRLKYKKNCIQDDKTRPDIKQPVNAIMVICIAKNRAN
jgi:hypothetical protein